jgi:hypothetical protein
MKPRTSASIVSKAVREMFLFSMIIWAAPVACYYTLTGELPRVEIREITLPQKL